VVEAMAAPEAPSSEERNPERGALTGLSARVAELVREHRSTLVFVNSRRLSERLATAVDDAAGEELALAHHGSVAREKRADIEGRLKRGELRALVATSKSFGLPPSKRSRTQPPTRYA